jgi:hypothetical protein
MHFQEFTLHTKNSTLKGLGFFGIHALLIFLEREVIGPPKPITKDMLECANPKPSAR